MNSSSSCLVLLALMGLWLVPMVAADCTDATLNNSAWTDPDGHNCSSFTHDNCSDTEQVDGLTAHDACCVCGGGLLPVWVVWAILLLMMVFLAVIMVVTRCVYRDQSMFYNIEISEGDAWGTVFDTVGDHIPASDPEEDGTATTDTRAAPAINHTANRTAFMIWRGVVFVYMASVVLVQIIQAPNAEFEIYFTVWNYNLQLIYYGFAFASSVVGLRAKGPFPVWLARVTAALFEICVPVCWLVTAIVYSVLCVNKGPDSFCWTFWSWNQHLVNTVCLTIEFVVSRQLVRPNHFSLVVIWSYIYVVFCWLQQIGTGIWPYFFLEFTEYSPMYYACLFVAMCFIFGSFVLLTSCCKLRLFHGLRSAKVGYSQEIES